LAKAKQEKAPAGKAVDSTAPVAEAATGTDTAVKPRKSAKAAAGKASKAAVGYADKPWLKSYPAGIPVEIGPLPAASIGDFMADACRQHGNRAAFTCMGKSITFADLERLSSQLGAYFQSVGLKDGARVAIMMPNILQSPVTMMAALRSGCTVVNVNPLYTARELEYQLNDSGAEAIVILENFAHTLQAAIGKTKVKHVIVAAMGDLLGLKGLLVNLVVRRVKKMVPPWSLPGHVRFNNALKLGAAKTFRPARVGSDEVAFLQYTGGTTGVSKGAVLLHRNVLSNVQQNAAWVQDAYSVKPMPADLTYVCALPLYHIFALTVNALMGIQQGANNIMIPNPRDIPGFVKELGKQPFHVFVGLNTLFNALLNNEEFRKLDFKPMILTLAGGMAVQRAVAERWLQLTGCPITEGYGLSETSPVATANKFSVPEFTGTIGLPLPSTEIAIRDDQGNDLPIGEVGEICIRGPQVMAGYWNRPDETAKVMTKDGFFTSGDIGRMDERGYVTIVDRKKDMILVSGFKVFPNELEDVIARHPGVLEVAVVGVPDEHSGEVPKLFVVKKDQALTAEDLAAFCKENLTGYKRPRYIEFRTELPKSNVGKILRRELRG
jgi:long-chain acyl-CoA synthetase